MRLWIILTAVAILGTGCTHTALERRTVKQASTLTDLQHQQVLDNLAMLACNPDTMPWHLKLKGGLVQIADQGNAGFEANLASGISNEVKNIFSPTAGAQRGVVGQWDVDPAVEADELNLLRLAYAKAVKAGQPANPSLAEVEEKIDDATCDLAIRFDVLPSEQTLKRLLQRKREKLLWEARTKVGGLVDKLPQDDKCKDLKGLVTKARGDLDDKTKDDSTKLHDARDALRVKGAESIVEYCEAKKAEGEAHWILNSASGQGDQRRKLGLLREAYQILQSLAGEPKCEAPPPSPKWWYLEQPKKEQPKKEQPKDNTSLAARLQITEYLNNASAWLSKATTEINGNRDAYEQLTMAAACLTKARDKVKDATDAPGKDKGELTTAARCVCPELTPADMDKLIESYCSVLETLDGLHSRAHDIDRVIGPSTQQEGGSGSEIRALTAPRTYKTEVRVGRSGESDSGTAPGALTVVVAQPTEREEAARRILKVLAVECGTSFMSREDAKSPTRRNPGLIDQAEDKVKALQDLAEPNSKFNAPWFYVGCKKDVPKCACYVGHYRACGRECYVWVMPEQVGMLREFTQVILTLAPNEKQDLGSLIPGRGAAFSPSLR